MYTAVTTINKNQSLMLSTLYIHTVYVGSEFWRPQMRIGDDMTGIRYTIDILLD